MLRPRLAVDIGALPAALPTSGGVATEAVVDRALDVTVDVAVLRFVGDPGVVPGDPVTVALGADGSSETAFVGSVARVGADVTTRGGHRGEVVAFGRLQSLVALRVAAVYEQATLGAVGRDLFTQAGLVPGAVDEGPLLPRVVVDVRRSAADHLRGLAARFGRQLWADRHGRANLGVPGGPDLGGLPALAGVGGLRYGADVLAATGRRQPPAFDGVEVAGESPASTHGDRTVAWLTTDETAARARVGGDRAAVVLEPLARTRDLAQAAASGRADAWGRRAAQVVVTVLGRADLDLGARVAISGAPAGPLAAGGTVRALRHRFDSETGFTTTVRLAGEAAP